MIKNLVVLLLVVLCSGCYSYKPFSNVSNLQEKKIYKVKITDKSLKIKIDSIKNYKIYYSINKKVYFFPVNDSLSISQKKFSSGKTIGLGIGIIGGIAIIYEIGKNETIKAINQIEFPSIP